MVKEISKNGPKYSDTLLKGMECLWLGFHSDSNYYLTMPLHNDFFQKRVLNGRIGTINQAGLYGAEVEFPVDNERGFVRLNLSVKELLPMTTQQRDILRESILGEIIVSTQTNKVTYRCVETGCSFIAASPQGLGTHRVKTHNLQPQKRGGLRVKVSSISSKPILDTGDKTTTKTSVSTNWKARYDAMVKRYNRLASRHDSVLNTLEKISKLKKL